MVMKSGSGKYKVGDICDFMQFMAPLEFSEDWDNTGLLIGDSGDSCDKLLTCLTLTEDVVDEAIEKGARLVITHHPMPFRGMKKIEASKAPGRLVFKLISNGISVYSAHTAFDSAENGLNDRLAACCGIPTEKLSFLKPMEGQNWGAGRIGDLSQTMSLQSIADSLKHKLAAPTLKVVGDLKAESKRLAFACGSGGDFFSAAWQKRADVFITGEASFHTCLAARDAGVGLILLGHYYSERFAMEQLAEEIAERFPGVSSTPSANESNPITFT